MSNKTVIQKLAADALNSFRDYTQVVADGLEERSDLADRALAGYLREVLGDPITIGLISHWTDSTFPALEEVVSSLIRLAKNPYYLVRSTKRGRAIIKVYSRNPRKSVLDLTPTIVDGRATDIPVQLKYEDEVHDVVIPGATVERILLGSPIFGTDEEYHPRDIERLRKTMPELDISYIKPYDITRSLW